MLQSGQVLCDQYQLVEQLGRSPGRQTWRALDLGTMTRRPVEQRRVDPGRVEQEPVDPAILRSADGMTGRGTAEADLFESSLLESDPWDSADLPKTSELSICADASLESSPGAETVEAAEGAEVAETVILKLLAFSDEIDWGQVKLFEREAAVLKGLNHPALPRYRDSFSLEDRLLWFGLVQDDIPGQSLDQLLIGGGPRLNEAQLRQWAGDLLEILIYLHGQSPPILHRDIKPSNVIWGDDQQIYLIDLGAVQDYVAKATLGSSFTVVGTYGYAPLEQFGGRSVPASDLYALGATLVHLLTGIAPADLPQENLRLQFEQEISPQLGPNISLGFRRWLQHLLEPDVQRRTPSARAALMALRQLPGLSAQGAGQISDQISGQILGQVSGQGAPPVSPLETATQFPRRQPGQNPPAAPSSFSSLKQASQPPAISAGSPSPSALASHGPSRLQPSSASLELLAAPTPTALASVGARLRLKRSPDLLLVEMPGEELGYVFAVLGVGFSLWALLVSSATLPFCLLFTLLGIFLATPQVLRFERRGSDIRFSLGKQLGGYLLRWGRHRASGSLRQVFHTVESPRISNRQSGQRKARLLSDRPRDDQGDVPGNTTRSARWLNRYGFGDLQSNRRTLVVQTQQREMPISTSLNWQEGTWLVDQIYAWCDAELGDRWRER